MWRKGGVVGFVAGGDREEGCGVVWREGRGRGWLDVVGLGYMMKREASAEVGKRCGLGVG